MDLNFPGSDDGIDCCNKYKTYEQACETAIKYCLERLVGNNEQKMVFMK